MIAALIASLLSVAHAAAAPAPFEPNAEERAAAGSITEDSLRAHVRFLSDDLLEGRGPASRGDSLAQAYIAAQFESLGLKPAAPGGGWLQAVPLVGVDTKAPETLSFRRDGRSVELALRKDYIAVSGVAEPKAGFADAELVFVGYGIQAPEYGWDDYKGAELKGKVLLMLNNDPADDPKLFAGSTRLYYGRWTYKYEIAASLGAAGALILHTAPSAGYPWQVVETSWSGEQFELRGEAGPRLQAKGWLTEEAARRVVGLSGRELGELRAAAESREFRPVPLGVRLSLTLENTVREQESANVLAVLPGSEPALKEQFVVVMAHHDHLGQAPESLPGKDRVYNGALDNASGAASLLAMARAYAALPRAPGRSILFAAVAAEEQGLLGSKHLSLHPPAPAGRLAAAINIDGANIWGKARDVVAVGYGKSSLDGELEAIAAWQGRTVKPDSFPDRGFYYRSDQFNMAKIGVPSVYLGRSVDFAGKPAGWGKEQLERWEATHYHQVSDELRVDWDLSGAVEDARLLFHLGLRAASNPELPRWTPGDEFAAAREAALKRL